ncbi:choice-of-anchor J domain-containing protein [Fibrella sp. WM1]|uniref:choice-of-anchor J domain-containing protein n=1 Tax=Fibrella musci TaxID=3242485 RepID=UPI0035227D5E
MKHALHSLLASLLLCTFLGLLATPTTAQVLFKETFNNIPGSTAGGAGTYAFPTGWRLRNVDNRTPNSSVGYVNDAWERREDFRDNSADSAAFSTSWYAPTGAADDWMWTPLIGPISATTKLRWRGLAYDPLYRDGYEVRVMTADQGPPTGGNGAIGNQVTNSTVVFSVANENSAWTNREISLSSFAGKSVYIAFRNNSNDQFLLLIDDVEVVNVAQYDAQLVSAARPSNYSKIPTTQVSSLSLAATIRNQGTQSLTNVKLAVDVQKDGNTIETLYSDPVATLSSGATVNLSIAGGYTPTAGAGTYTFLYRSEMTQTDEVPGNSTAQSGPLQLTVDTYSRHTGLASGNLGIGDNSGQGELGSLFTFVQSQALRHVAVDFNAVESSTQVKARIYSTTGGLPTTNSTLLWESSPVTLTNTTPQTVAFTGPALSLAPGTYLFALLEVDKTLTVASHVDIFTPSTQFVRFPGNANGAWTTVETFGTQFAKTLAISPISGCAQPITPTLIASSTAVCAPSQITLTAGGGSQYAFSGPGLSQSGSSNTAVVSQSGTYSVVVSDGVACSAVTSLSVTVNTPPNPPTVSTSLTVSTSTTPFPLSSLVTAAASHTLTFYGANGPVQPPVANISQAGVQTFSAVQTSPQGCVSPAAVFSLTVITPLPPSTQTTCRGTQLVLTIPTAGVRYQWFRLNGTSSLRLTDAAGVQRGTATASLTLLSPQTSATYTCQVTQANGSVQTVGPFAVQVSNCSGGRVAAVEPGESLQVRVVPNPLVNNRLRAIISGAGGQSLRVELTDTQGRTLRQQQWQQATDDQRLDWDVSQTGGGILFLRATTDQQSHTVKVIKE